MQSVFYQYRNQQIDYRQFLLSSREVLGEQLYGQLYQRLSAAASTKQQQPSAAASPMIGGTSSSPILSQHSQQQQQYSMPSMYLSLPIALTNIDSSGTLPHLNEYSVSSAQTQAQTQAQAPTQTLSHSNEAGESDVSRINAENLHDVMQYTGFDLRMEAEHIIREYAAINQHEQPGRNQEEDLKGLPQYFFNVQRLRSIVHYYARTFGLREVDERVYEILSLALQRRLRDVIELLVRISKHRVDNLRRFYKIKIDNDPRKQFWLLERLRTDPPWRQPHPQQQPVTQNQDKRQSLAEQHPLIIGSSSSHGALHDQKKKQQDTKAKEETASLKSKLTNVTAMAAAGMKQRSWMTSTGPSVASPTPAASDPSTGEEAVQELQPIDLSRAPSSIPLTDNELAAQLKTRMVTRRDFLSACDMDPRLRRSRLHIQLLDMAPLLQQQQQQNGPSQDRQQTQ